MLKKIDRSTGLLIAIGTGSFMSAMDGSIVNTILPVLRSTFQSNVAAIEWVVVVYLLVLSGLLLTFGRLGDLRGHKSVYVWGFGIFILGSAMSGAAWSAAALIVFRSVQAIGGAMLASNSPAIVTGAFSPQQRGRAFGLVAMLTYFGLTVGPALGGWLTQAFGWRTVFYVNVPVGALALALSLYFIPKDAPAESGQRFDLPGAALFLAALTALMLGLNKGADWGWASLPVLGLLGGAILLFVLFILVERGSPAPMLDLSLFRQPLFTTSISQRGLELYLCLHHHLPDAFLPDPGPRLEPGPGRTAALGAAGADGGRRADQRGAFRPAGLAPPGHAWHGGTGRGPAPAGGHWRRDGAVAGGARPGCDRDRHRDLHLAQHQRLDGLGAAQQAGHCLGRPGDGA